MLIGGMSITSPTWTRRCTGSAAAAMRTLGGATLQDDVHDRALTLLVSSIELSRSNKPKYRMARRLHPLRSA